MKTSFHHDASFDFVLCHDVVDMDEVRMWRELLQDAKFSFCVRTFVNLFYR